MNRVAVVSLAVFWIALHATAVAGAAAAGAATAAEAAAAAEQEAKGWFTGAAAHKREKRVIVIVGTAGSGTRNIHSLLAAAGVWMHPDTNKEFDSNVFIKRVKETPAFGLPGSQSGLIWETRASPADYRLDSLSADVYSELLQGHIQAAEELLASVPDDVAVWGWKEPQSIYTLPFLYRVFPNLHVIHEVRDGRDVALSNLNSTNLRTTRKFQRYYIQTFAGREYSDWQLTTHHFSKAAAGAWAQVNLNTKKWATEAGWGVKGQYSITRLEDFCDPASIHAAIRTMFSNAGVPFNQASVRRAAAAIDPRKCETDRWKAAWDADDEVLAAAIRNIDASIGGALEAFNYRSQSPLEMQSWLAAPAVMTGLREVALYTARAIPEWDGSIPPARPIILTEVSNGYEAVLENWLNWLQAGGVDLTRVLVVTKGSSAASVKAIVDGMGPSVYEMPPLETPEITIMNKNDDPVLNTLWVERMRMLYEIVGAGVPVVMSDLDAIWFRDALSDIEAKAAAQPGGFDMALSQGMWPPETYRVFRTSGCLGLAFFNATAGSRAVLRHMLAHAQRNMHLMFDDQQALNHQLVMANLLVNSTTPAPSGLQDSVVIGSQITTAPDPLRVLFLPHVQYQRFCDDATMKNAVVGHCRIRDVQNFKTPQMKQQLMKSMGLWKKETRDWLLPSPSPEPIVRSPDFWLPPPWIGTPPPLNPLACTPQLLIIAAPKAGTTAVYDYLNGTIAGFTVHSEAVHFLNGSEASKQYMTEFRKLPEEKRRFHPRLAGSFLKEMHIFDSNISLIPERLKQFPGINAATDDPLAGICSFEAAASAATHGSVEEVGEVAGSSAAAAGVEQHDGNALLLSSSTSNTGELVYAAPSSEAAGSTDSSSNSSSNSQVAASGFAQHNLPAESAEGSSGEHTPPTDDGSSSVTVPSGTDSGSNAVLGPAPVVEARTLLHESSEQAVAAGASGHAAAAVSGSSNKAPVAASTGVGAAVVGVADYSAVADAAAVAAHADSSSSSSAPIDASPAIYEASAAANVAATASVDAAAGTPADASSSTASSEAATKAASPAAVLNSSSSISDSTTPIAEEASPSGAARSTATSNSDSSSIPVAAEASSTGAASSTAATSSDDGASSSAPAGPALVRFEATPAYLHTALAVTQLKELLPQARYLVLLREPVSRVISHFNMRIQGQALLDEVAPGNYSSGWADYIASEVERQMSTLNKCSARISRHSPVPAYTQLANCLFGLPVSRDINEYDLYKGLYDLHLQRWFDHFEPEQTLIWSSRAFSLAPKQHLEQLVGWLGLDPAEINRRIDFVKIHERSYPDDQPMPAWLFEQLVQFYEPHKQATLQLLQKVGYLQLAEQLGAAWEEELAYTQQKLVRQAAATRR